MVLDRLERLVALGSEGVGGRSCEFEPTETSHAGEEPVQGARGECGVVGAQAKQHRGTADGSCGGIVENANSGEVRGEGVKFA